MSADPHADDFHREKSPTLLKGLAFFGLLILVLAALFFAASQLRSKEGPRVAATPPTPLTVSVVETQLSTTFELDETYSGLAEARRTSQLGFSSGGRISVIKADIGDRVGKGQSLAVLDTRGVARAIGVGRSRHRGGTCIPCLGAEYGGAAIGAQGARTCVTAICR